MNRAKLQLLLGRVWYDIAAAQSAPLVVLGRRLGLYRALRSPRTVAEVVEETGVAESYVRAWLSNQASSGYVTHDASSGTYRLDEEQAAVFTDENLPGFAPSGFDLATALTQEQDRLERSARGANSGPWNEQIANALDEIAAVRARNGLANWIPAGKAAAFTSRGGDVLEVGCGRGGMLFELASRFPLVRATGADLHPPSIADARDAANERGLGDRIRFETADASTLSGPFDAVFAVEVLHESVDPVTLVRALRSQLRRDGMLIVVEPSVPAATGAVDAHRRLLTAAEFLFCLPAANGGPIPGPCAGESSIRTLLEAGGFANIETRPDPYHLVLIAST